MRIIICGGGQVGYNIAAYLSREENDVTVIDVDPEIVDKVNNELDVNAIMGHASKPDIIDAAGASEADMLIAVTSSDEVNMVACQVAHSLFNVPKKVARIRDQSYLDPAWFNLFSRSQMPIDVIISPEKAVAESIVRRIMTPGTTNVITLAEDNILVVGIKCEKDCPLINTQLGQVKSLFHDLKFNILNIFREGDVIIPDENDQMIIGDEVYIIVDRSHLKRILEAFGHNEKRGHKILLLGGGNIARSFISLLYETKGKYSITVIEKDRARAVSLSEDFEDIIVLNGDCLSQDILREADVENTDTAIVITNDDEANILTSLLVDKLGVERVVTLVNKNSFSTIISSLGIDDIVSPRSITVSSVMQHVRRGRIKSAHNIKDGSLEIIEIELSETSGVINRQMNEIGIPKNIVVAALVRKGEVIIPDEETVFKLEDHVIILSRQEDASIVEEFFSIKVGLL